MLDRFACPYCSQIIRPGLQRCPHCGKELVKSTPPFKLNGTGPLTSKPGTGPFGRLKGSGSTEGLANGGHTNLSTPLPGTGPLPRLGGTGALTEPATPQVAPEILVPRLGDILVEKGIVRVQDLQRALEYQQKKAEMGHPRLLGRALIELGMIDRETLDQVITNQIATLHTALQEANRQLEQRVEGRTQDLERRLVLIRTAAEITGTAITAQKVEDLLERTVNLIVERLNYYHASVFLLDETSRQVLLAAASGEVGRLQKLRGYRLALDTNSITTWVARFNQPRIATDVSKDILYRMEEMLPNTQSEACFPLSIGDSVLGVLDIQCTEVAAFEPGEVEVLQVIAYHITAMIQNLRLLDQTQRNLRETSLLNLASQKIAGASKAMEIFNAISTPLQNLPCLSAIFIAKEDSLQVHAIHDPQPRQGGKTAADYSGLTTLPIRPAEIANRLNRSEPHVTSTADSGEGLPDLLTGLFRHAGCENMALLPMWTEDRLTALIAIGWRRPDEVASETLKVLSSLAEMAGTALEKVNALESIQRQVVVLQTLDSVSRAVSMEINPDDLYRVIHRQLEQVIGEVNFLIALYDDESSSIQIPYAYEEGNLLQLPAIPLGQGLTSIVIRSKEPLLLVENTEQRATELGAQVVGAPAKSWLGVPLMVGGEVIGAIVLQDLEREHRFNQDDVRLISNLASQVAVSVRNAHLLAQTRRNAERERVLSDITSRLWASTEMESILRTAVAELGSALKARRGKITLQLDRPE